MATYVCVMHVWNPENGGGEIGSSRRGTHRGYLMSKQRLGLKDHFPCLGSGPWLYTETL